VEKPLSNKIKEKTHITDEMLEGKPKIKEVLQNIVKFIGKDPLIAHNGINFDMRFLNKKLIQNNMAPLNNTIIDTMLLSYAIDTDISRHALGVIAHHYHIMYDEVIAHRADFDAEALYKV
jgi:DNA polymerase-3 subunit alpha (Gram-positive type)